MPMYDFSCQRCGAVFEELLTNGNDAAACPTCGADGAVRLLSAPSPLKTGAFPFKPGPVHPAASRMAGGCGGGSCPGGSGFS
ncbi:MAG: zinc ribbon domain-containing protein [Deltaproteobacteria bacterium]|jgi:putative FmdB family regulatory protein|nr:zinc ribbon domain-containing protein [Deltaproteobacteria bacterium]